MNGSKVDTVALRLTAMIDSNTAWSSSSSVRVPILMPALAMTMSTKPPARKSAAAACSAERSRRSEEHTSELQSLMRISYAVFCLKKKKITTSISSKKLDKHNNRHQ